MDTATKTGIDAAKTASKRVVQNTAEATGDLISNKIRLIRSLQQVKQRKRQINQKKWTFRQKKGNKLLMISDCFE